MDPPGHLGLRLAKPLEIVEHHKPLHPQAMRDEACHVADADELVVGAVVFAHLARNDDPPVLLHVEDRGVQHLAAHIVEIDVDAVRAVLADRRAQIRAPIGEAGVEAEPLHIVALRRGACNADNAASLHLRDLPGGGAHRPCGRRNQHRVAFLRAPEFQQTEIGGEPRNAEHADRRRWPELPVIDRRVQHLHAAPVRDRMGHPAEAAGYPVAHLELLVLRRLDHAHHRAVDGLAQRQCRRVAVARKPSAHAGIDRMELGADQDFMLADLRQPGLLQPEILRPRLPRGPRRQHPSLRFCRHVVSSPHILSSLRGAKRRSNPGAANAVLAALDCFACARNDVRGFTPPCPARSSPASCRNSRP